MIARFAQHGQLDSPWGVALAPATFGDLAGQLLIGNFGNGQINAYSATTGEFVNKVRNPHGQAIVIDGLWTIMFGNGGNGGDKNKLYFTAGPNGESDGLFGSLSRRRIAAIPAARRRLSPRMTDNGRTNDAAGNRGVAILRVQGGSARRLRDRIYTRSTDALPLK